MSHVLICVDGKHKLRLLEANLNREGHNVMSASRGLIAIRLLEEIHFDTFIFDPSLPDLLEHDPVQWIALNKPEITVHILELP